MAPAAAGDDTMPPSAETSFVSQTQGPAAAGGRAASDRAGGSPDAVSGTGGASRAAARSQALARLKRRSLDGGSAQQAQRQQQPDQQQQDQQDQQQRLNEQHVLVHNQQQELEQLELQCRQLHGDNQRLQAQLQEAQQLLAAARQQPGGTSPGHLHLQPYHNLTPASFTDHAAAEELRHRLAAAQLALDTIQRAHTAAVEQCALLKAEHERNVLRVHEDVRQQEQARWQARVSALQMQLSAAESRAQQLQAELAKVRARVDWSPAAHDFAALEERIGELERAQDQEQAAAAHASEMHHMQVRLELLSYCCDSDWSARCMCVGEQDDGASRLLLAALAQCDWHPLNPALSCAAILRWWMAWIITWQLQLYSQPSHGVPLAS
jgi:hypothetical protein